MTVCRLQTAQTDDRTQFCIYFSIFYLPRDYMYRGLKKIIIIITQKQRWRLSFKVRFLEAQNRKLADELEKLKSKWGKETSQIKAMYQAELDEARRLLDEAEKDKARLEIRVASLEEQLEETRNK